MSTSHLFYRHCSIYYFFPSDRIFLTGTSYQTLQSFWWTFGQGQYCDRQLRRHLLINLKTFVLNWCRMLLFCNIYVIYFSLTCWIWLMIMTSNFCWRLNKKEYHWLYKICAYCGSNRTWFSCNKKFFSFLLFGELQLKELLNLIL